MKPVSSPSLSVLLEKIKEKSHSLVLEGLWGSAKAYLATEIVRACGRSILLLTGGVREDRLFHDLAYFAPSLTLEFPAWETLPGEEIQPSCDILGKRFEALYTLAKRKGPSIVLCPLPSFLQKVLSKKSLSSYCIEWKIGTKIAFQEIPSLLLSLGYKREAIVSDKGQFALRGGIVDLFPASATDPYRVDFFDDEIDAIRTFDPIGQKSNQKVDRLFLSPAQELPLLQKESSLLGIEDFLEEPILFWDDLLSIEDAYVSLKEMPGAKSPFFASFGEKLAKFRGHLFCSNESIEQFSAKKHKRGTSPLFQSISFALLNQTFEAERFFHPFRKIGEELPPSVLCVAPNETDHEEMKKKHAELTTAPFQIGSLSGGFVIEDGSFALLSYADVSGKAPIRRQKWRSSHHTPPSEFHHLQAGDLVVHFHSGIGKYLGLEKQKNHLGVETEFLILEYAGQSKLFVPLSQSHLVSRYIGAKEERPPLSELGTKRWQKVRDHATSQIVGYAHDLLQAQAERVFRGGFIYPPDGPLMEQFEKDFPYIETEDQLLSIRAIKEDMRSEKPMDRLICGDVGYGKTEVAMRAACKAVVDGGKQVAVLVPTTVLAMQHFDTFSQRMAPFPIKVDVVSRFRTAKQSKETLEKVYLGQVDVLIGTHRLLSQDVKFKDLGLIIIDEEQRFGVRSKEHLKKLKTGVDCLTLSATPIPRTLYMSLIHAREMSVIHTPPQDRLPIKTIIAETEHSLIQNALMREFSRGGQAFYIHNRVETIYGRAEEIQKLVPQARVAVVHGQMDSDEIDSIFHRFKEGGLDLLFATTIIENGIDVPNANTILIDRADTYGLADLYQLRGRVGRWNRAAYAYFLIPRHVRLTEVAQKRLSALAESSGYGGGMKVAMRDLEIRGAGDILGVQQSGQVSAIGFHLYCKLLKKAIDALKHKKPISFYETKMEFSFSAYFPGNYISDVSIRMELYYRLGEVGTLEAVDDLFAEIEDRFGPWPEPVVFLYHLSRIRVFAAEKGIISLKFGTLSITAEKQMGKETKTHTFLMPKKMQHPSLLEKHVTEALSTKL